MPIQIAPSGGLQVARDEEKVKESIRTILSTAKGERVMRPDFGCDIHAYVFAALDATTTTLIKSAVREALTLWEPRIELKQVQVLRDEHREEYLRIEVSYTMRAANFESNLVYPFYLHAGR